MAAVAVVAGGVFGPSAGALRYGDYEPSETSDGGSTTSDGGSTTTYPKSTTTYPKSTPTPTYSWYDTCAVAPQGYPAGSGFDAENHMLVVSNANPLGTGNIDLLVVQPDRSTVTAVYTGSAEAEYDPTWDRSGSIMAWTTVYNGHFVVKVSRNGGNNAKIVNVNANDQQPSISPNGTEIAFNRSGKIMLGTLCGDDKVINVRQISPADGYYYSNPEFSPDASQIAMTSNREFGLNDVWRLVRSTNALYRVTCSGGDEAQWSPDGRQIAYTARDAYGSGNEVVGVVLVFSDCGNVAWMTNFTTRSFRPSWSRTGTQIGFLRRHADLSTDVFVVNTDRTGLRSVTGGFSGGQRGYDFVWR